MAGGGRGGDGGRAGDRELDPAPGIPAALPAALPAVGADFKPAGRDDFAQSGAAGRVRANLAALTVVRTLDAEARPATPAEQATLARWSGWGAVPEIFDAQRDRFAQERAELHAVLSTDEIHAAERSTLNAHYTDASIASAIWDGVARLGFAGGRVLEPGCGAGTFIGLAPANAQMTGIELDPITASIARSLYPSADVRTQSFADTRLASDFADLTIGNVPFGNVVLHDRTGNPNRHSLHNHFIVKSLASTRPGGLVAVLTSHWTMDSVNPAARRDIAAYGDLVAAVRLPSKAHREAAGTDVLTDVLILRRRLPGDEPRDATVWETTQLVDHDGDGPVPMNSYFARYPEHVLGVVGVRSGQFGPEIEVAGDVAGVGDRLRRVLAGIAEDTSAQGLRWEPRPAAAETALEPAPSIDAGSYVGLIREQPDGRFTITGEQGEQWHDVPGTQRDELAALLGLRDTFIALVAAEGATMEDTDELGELRALLNTQYDAYASRFGPVNRSSRRATKRIDTETGEPIYATIRPAQGRFREDPFAAGVYALEHYDVLSDTAAKADIFRERMIAPRPQRLGADTAADALSICMESLGRVELGEISRLLGVDAQQAREQLTGRVFDDPADPDRLVSAAEYLSGNVRAKLAAAEEMAATTQDPRWAENVAALSAVQPVDLLPGEIDARMGASWIDAAIIQQFLTETLDDRSIRVENPGGSMWAVSGARHTVLASNKWGTRRMAAPDIAKNILEQRAVVVRDPQESGSPLVNIEETVAAQEKAVELNEEFSNWLWAEPERAMRMARIYNDQLNNIVLRTYDGSDLQLPGMATLFKPRAHQYAAIARIVSEPSVGLFHDVGAGKTATMVAGAMELRRLGMARKIAVVVPNHMLEQFSREWLQLYPQAKLLAASSDDLTADRRRVFVAKVATGDWDAIVVSQSAFSRIPMHPDTEAAYLDREVDHLRQMLANSQGNNRMTVKRMQSAIARAEQALKAKLDSAKDPGITFEELGIDYLMVDEAHMFKNLRVASNIEGAGHDGSQRASDLDMKLSYLRERHGARVATFATATPIANSISEAYVMQHYLQPDVLEAAGLDDFDRWAATFGTVVSDMEMSPAGGYRLNSRFAKFRNVPELLRQMHLYADVKTAEDLKLPTPELAGGAASTVVVAAGAGTRAFMRDLGERAERVKSGAVKPEEDNMLSISTSGKSAALDLRLVGWRPDEYPKIERAADAIADIYRSTKDQMYGDSPTPGALQLVFSDSGTPREGWNVYDELRDQLGVRGVPRSMVRFIHEAKNDKQKGELFEAARAGQVAVLIGSTAKMGVGTNVQRRAIAEHHLDCPWRPADLAQRDGRIMRQGNLNAEVQIARYVTEGSFDTFSWQTVERKAKFIGQIMRGSLDVREIEDISVTALSYSEVKALASGNPLLLDKARIDAEVSRLTRLERSHFRSQSALAAAITYADKELVFIAEHGDHLAEVVPSIRDTQGDLFAMTVGQHSFAKRTDAAAALAAELRAMQYSSPPGTTRRLGTIGGLGLSGTVVQAPERHVALVLGGVSTSIDILPEHVSGDAPIGVITRLENRLADLRREPGRLAAQAAKATSERERATAELGTPFAGADKLAQARAESDRVVAALREQEERRKAENLEAAQQQPQPVTDAPEPYARSYGRASTATRSGPPDRRTTFPVTADSGAPAPAPSMRL